MPLSNTDLRILLARLLPDAVTFSEHEDDLCWNTNGFSVRDTEYAYLVRVAVIEHTRGPDLVKRYIQALYAIVDARLPQHPELGGALEWLEPLEIAYQLSLARWDEQLIALATMKGMVIA